MKVDGLLIIPATVEYVIGASNYSIIMLVDGTRVLSSHNLKRVVTYLKLTRIHKQHAVNSQYVAEIDLMDRVVMRSGKVLEVSRRKIGEGVLRQLIKTKNHGLTQNSTH